MCVRARVCVRACVRACVCVRVCVWVCVRVCVCVHMHEREREREGIATNWIVLHQKISTVHEYATVFISISPHLQSWPAGPQ